MSFQLIILNSFVLLNNRWENVQKLKNDLDTFAWSLMCKVSAKMRPSQIMENSFLVQLMDLVD